MTDGTQLTLLSRGLLIAELDRIEDLRAYEQPSDADVGLLERSAAAVADGDDLLWRVRLLRAELVGRTGELAEARRQLQDVYEYAVQYGQARLLSRTHLTLAWTCRDIGDLTAYLEHTVQAVEQLDEEAPLGMRAKHLTRLADALDECGSWDEARGYYDQAEEVAVLAGDTTRLITCLNNRAYGEYLCGDLPGATHTIQRLEQVCRRQDVPMRSHTFDTLARVQIQRGHLEEAVQSSGRAMRAYAGEPVREVMAPAEFLLTRAVAERHLGLFDAAARTIDETRVIATEAGLKKILAQVDEEHAQLHAAQGDFEAAYRSFVAFHAAEKQLLSERRATQARLRHAMLETAKVRASADRFRDQALRDPLTQLPNRRSLDGALSRMLSDPTTHPIAAAVLDLDHFKRINDSLSHTVGDEVLVRVAQLLRDSLTRWSSGTRTGLVARMGGEEFIVVLTGAHNGHVLEHVDELRRTVANHDWAPITGGGLSVTLSAGVAWIRDGDSQLELFRRADDLLYAAKRSGRNRVCAEDVT